MNPYFKKDKDAKTGFDAYVAFTEISNNIPFGRYDAMPVLVNLNEKQPKHGSTHLCYLTYVPELEIFAATLKEEVTQKQVVGRMPW